MTGGRIEILQGDITQQDVDAVVNAANTTLLGGGGVDGAIHLAAGPGLLQVCWEIQEVEPGVRCPTGEARTTPGFLLKAKFVIHTAGPVYRSAGTEAGFLLEQCYRACLHECRRIGARSIAFPAISCGVYGYPVQEAVKIARATVLQEMQQEMQQETQGGREPIQLVRFVCFAEEIHQAYIREFNGDSIS